MNVVTMIREEPDPLAQRIRDAYERTLSGQQEWIEGSLEMAISLREGRLKIRADIGFSAWLKQNNVDYYNKDERAALISLAGNLELAREILMAARTRSYDLIWRENKDRFRRIPKPDGTSTTRRRSPSLKIKDFNREEKLGADTLTTLQGTSLDNSKELDELVVLNRGAKDEGEKLTPVVKQLVEDAKSGKDVSAIAHSCKIGGRKVPKGDLISAWKKRMVAAWQLASADEKERLLQYLIDDLPPEQRIKTLTSIVDRIS